MGVTLHNGLPIMEALAYAGSLKIQDYLSNPEILASNLIRQAQGQIVSQGPTGISVQLQYVSRYFVDANKYFRLGTVDNVTDPTESLTGDALKSAYRKADKPVTIKLESETVSAEELSLQLFLTSIQMEAIARSIAEGTRLETAALTWQQSVGSDSALGAMSILNDMIAHEFELKLVRKIISAIINATNDGRTTTVNPSATNDLPSYWDFVRLSNILLAETGRLFTRSPLIGVFHPQVAQWIYMIPEFKETGVTTDARNLLPEIYKTYDVPVVSIANYKGGSEAVDCYMNIVSLPGSVHYWVNTYDGPSFGPVGRRTYGPTILRGDEPIRLPGENIWEFIFRMQMAATVPKTVRPVIAIYPIPVAAVS